ncbi:hypothetical protein DYU11_08295 [Fibrisoma montanum]|uniref:Uncharacterized protein n=2 Tax=Fibrisoma montanum TaxID=2305895 RepID=A0A418MEX5_9BACT|nr:hypothetical protein DYU11_08295 [Fibrisoma montanum]
MLSSLAELRAQTVTYDYHTRAYSPQINFVRHGAMVSYRIININPFAQKVIINGQAISMTSEIPAQLATLFNVKIDTEKELTNTKDQVKEMADVQKNTAQAGLKAALNTLVDSCSTYYEEAEKIEEALLLKEHLAKTMADKSFYNDSVMRSALNDRSINTTTISDLKADYEEFEEAYHQVYNQYQAAIQAARTAGDKDKEARIMNAFDQVKKDYRLLEKQYQETLFDIKDLYAKATDPRSYEVISLPLKLTGRAGDADEVEFEILIDDKKFPTPDAFNVDSGLKVDFSAGPVFNFTADNRYFFDATNKLQQQTKPGLFNVVTPTVSAMMHVYPRRYKGVAWGGTFGVNANVKELTDINLGFLAGISAIMGRSQKVIVSTGASYLRVDRLKEGQFTVGTVYNDTKIEDVTESVLRPSWFVAVSLSLGKRKILTP